jgi:hypothetical protein
VFLRSRAEAMISISAAQQPLLLVPSMLHKPYFSGSQKLNCRSCCLWMLGELMTETRPPNAKIHCVLKPFARVASFSKNGFAFWYLVLAIRIRCFVCGMVVRPARKERVCRLMPSGMSLSASKGAASR